MFANVVKFVAKSYLTLTAVIVLSVFAVFVIFAGLIAFVHMLIPG